MTGATGGSDWSPGEDLLEVLAAAQGRGAIGPIPLADHVRHALGFLAAWPDLADATAVLDLGSGGGLPGLVLAARLPETRFVLLDGRMERARLLETMVDGLGWADRVAILAERAEVAAHRPGLRRGFPAVVARGFGPPAATAECGTGFLAPEGVLVVSGPPGGAPERWLADPLGELGLELVDVVVLPPSFVVLKSVAPCPERFPRRVGVPEHRPLF
jgi:16S rRNA (guanine527-N7)-methyltransferase